MIWGVILVAGFLALGISRRKASSAFAQMVVLATVVLVAMGVDLHLI